MRPFDYIRPTAMADAVSALRARPDAQVLAGGTNLIDLMKYDVTHPSAIIDINDLPLKEIDITEDNGLRIGALTTNAQVAYDSNVLEHAPLLSSAILAGASPQLRNAATSGGNLLQRTRCYYFYDPSTPCNKREPGSGCSAIGGLNRIHAILGASDQCIATHPSDMCVALAALDAKVDITGPDGERIIPFLEFHRLPDAHPERDNTLQRGEIVTAIRRVTDIMGEISAASSEQSAGVAQVGDAITQMDQATQQNAALVEQSAAAAQSLQQQAQAMVASVSVFRTAAADAPAVTVATAAASRATVVASLASRPALAPMAARPAQQIAAATPAKATKAAKTTTADDEEWAAF